MPTWRTKPPNRNDRNKRYSRDERTAIGDAAQSATARLYNDVFMFWKNCRDRRCKRHRRCAGDATACLTRCKAGVPVQAREKARTAVIAGGPKRIKPANHAEWCMRQTPVHMWFW